MGMGMGWDGMGQDGSLAGSDLLGALVDGADVSDHVGLDGVLGGGGVLSVDDDPGDVGVGRVECLGGLGHVDLVVDAGLGGGAGADGVPVEGELGGALLALGGPVAGAGLEADDEGQRLGVLVVEAEGAGLDEVALALAHAVLAGERPARPVLGPPGVAVGVEVEVADLPEVRRVRRRLQRPHDELLAVRAQRLEVQVHLHAVVVGHHGHHGVAGHGLQVVAHRQDCQAAQQQHHRGSRHDRNYYGPRDLI